MIKFILQQNLYHMIKSIKGLIKIGNIQQDLKNLLKGTLSALRSAFEVAWQTSGQVDDAVGQDLVNFLDHIARTITHKDFS